MSHRKKFESRQKITEHTQLLLFPELDEQYYFSESVKKISNNIRQVCAMFNFTPCAFSNSELFGKILRSYSVRTIVTVEDLYYYAARRALVRIGRMYFKKLAKTFTKEVKYKNSIPVLISTDGLFGVMIYTSEGHIYSVLYKTEYKLSDFLDALKYDFV